MAKKERYSVQEVIDALHAAHGYVSKAAKLLLCDPSTLYAYRNRHPTVAAAWLAIREKRHDYVENALMKRIDQGDTTAIIFYLKTQAKPRGYVERQEQKHFIDMRQLPELSDDELRRVAARLGVTDTD